jgi:hypothetical protein
MPLNLNLVKFFHWIGFGNMMKWEATTMNASFWCSFLWRRCQLISKRKWSSSGCNWRAWQAWKWHDSVIQAQNLLMAKIGAVASYENFSEGKSWSNFSPWLVKKHMHVMKAHSNIVEFLESPPQSHSKVISKGCMDVSV